MSEKDAVWKGKVKHTGIFDFGEFYKFCYAWLIDKDYKLIEKTYSEKVTPNGKLVEIFWDAKRKISDYFRFVIKAQWRIIGMTEVEVQKEGSKLKLNKGQLEITISALLEKDYESRWENSGFLKFLRGIYDRYIIRGRIEKYEEKLLAEVDEYVSQLKAFLALEGKHDTGYPD